MHRQPNRFALIRQGPLDRLLNPPHRIRAQLCPFRRVEALDRFGQSDVSLGDKVEQRQTEVHVVPRDRHHEP